MNPDNSEFTSEFFDQASKAWLENKVRYGASYRYKCAYIHSNKKQCSKPVVSFDYCKRHNIVMKSRMKSITFLRT